MENRPSDGTRQNDTGVDQLVSVGEVWAPLGAKEAQGNVHLW